MAVQMFCIIFIHTVIFLPFQCSSFPHRFVWCFFLLARCTFPSMTFPSVVGVVWFVWPSKSLFHPSPRLSQTPHWIRTHSVLIVLQITCTRSCSHQTLTFIPAKMSIYCRYVDFERLGRPCLCPGQCLSSYSLSVSLTGTECQWGNGTAPLLITGPARARALVHEHF